MGTRGNLEKVRGSKRTKQAVPLPEVSEVMVAFNYAWEAGFKYGLKAARMGKR